MKGVQRKGRVQRLLVEGGTPRVDPVTVSGVRRGAGRCFRYSAWSRWMFPVLGVEPVSVSGIRCGAGKCFRYSA